MAFHSSSSLPHFLGSAALLGFVRHVPDPQTVFACVASFGLACSGVAQLCKQGLEIYHARRALVRELSDLKAQGPSTCPYGRAEREACAARPKPDGPALPIPGRLPDGRPIAVHDGRNVEL